LGEMLIGLVLLLCVATVPLARGHIAYLWLAALGGALNLAAITANGGVMPADPDALAAAGVHQQAGDFANSTAVAHPHLAFLGDVFAVPASWPVSNVFSMGDVVLVVLRRPAFGGAPTTLSSPTCERRERCPGSDGRCRIASSLAPLSAVDADVTDGGQDGGEGNCEVVQAILHAYSRCVTGPRPCVALRESTSAAPAETFKPSLLAVRRRTIAA
jgi:hypothetical protein